MSKLNSLRTKEQWANPITRKRLLIGIRKGKNSTEYKKKTSRTTKKWWKNLSQSEKIKIRNILSISHRKENLVSGAIKNYSEAHKKHFKDPKARKRLKKQTSFLWTQESYQRTQALARHLKPNKPEKYLIELLNKNFPNEYKYVGDFQFWLGGKNPDFMNVNGQKKLIEFYGYYWHKDDNPKTRIKHFKKYGFDTLVIWDKELKNIDRLTNKLELFHKK